MEVTVHWTWIRSEKSWRWDETHCLYAYLDEHGDLLYIGKSWSVSIWDRLWGADKRMLARWMIDETGDYEPHVLHGEIRVRRGKKLTKELLYDIESLLIIDEQPPGNIQGKKTRTIDRPGMLVRCTGRLWPGGEYYFDE